jgi:hypothetical protein
MAADITVGSNTRRKLPLKAREGPANSPLAVLLFLEEDPVCNVQFPDSPTAQQSTAPPDTVLLGVLLLHKDPQRRQ